MKIYYSFFLVALLLIIASCTTNQNQQYASMDNMYMGKDEDNTQFKKMCQNAGYEWMLMKPTKDGKIIKEAESCWGCMVEGIEHVCDMNKFNEMTGMMETDMMENMGHDMGSMQHMAMTAHAGTRSSVDVHMYKIGLIRPDIQVGKEAILKFTINDLQAKKPISDLDVVHDKIMHIVLVRDDLKHFDHIHPETLVQGIFSVPYTFTSSGFYRIWIDFTIDGMQHIVDFDINVANNLESEEMDMLGGLKANFVSPKEIIQGEETELKFEILDKNSKPISITGKFLAANAHLIAIDDNLEEFNHNHDENFDKDNKLIFRHTFTKSGKYRLWVQFLAEGKVRTAGFDIAVE